ncbi:MAG: hypothetical protein AAFQ10_14095 [Pseudomonadota bacterium]
MTNDNIQSIEDFDPDAPPFAEFRDWCTVSECSTNNRQLFESKNDLSIRLQKLRKLILSIENIEVQKEIRSFYVLNLNCLNFKNSILELNDLVIPCSVNQKNFQVISENINIKNSVIEGDLNLFCTQINGALVVDGTRILGNLSLAGATLRGDFSFLSGEIAGYLSFNGAELLGDVNISNLIVGGECSFFKTKINGFVTANEADLSEGLIFKKSEIHEKLELIEVKIKKNLDIGNISSKSDIVFDNSTIGGNLLISKSNRSISGHVSGENAVVKSDFVFDFFHFFEASFKGLSVGGTTTFKGSSHSILPDFRDAEFGRAPEVANMRISPPEMSYRGAKLESHNGKIFQIAANSDDVAKYRKLKAMALAANDHEKDIEFFAYEMQAKRGVEQGSSTTVELLFNSAYYWLSNYGQSFKRPFYWMMGSFGFFGLFYLFFATQILPYWQAMAFALGHSFKNVVPLFTTLVRLGGRPEGYETNYNLAFAKLANGQNGTALVDGLLLVSYVQQFIGIVLLFLLLLALRNKFRLK